MDLVKSRKRVSDHGEVFTPEWMVNEMLSLVDHEAQRIDSRFLEPACGSGNFLIQVLQRKLATVEKSYGNNAFEKNHHALFALMCVYGIEILEDNAEECRANLMLIFSEYLALQPTSEVYKAAEMVLQVNIVLGDALAMTTPSGNAIEFPEWSYLTKGMYSRRDFSYDSLTQRSAVSGTLFDLMPDHEIFVPVREYPRLTIGDIANQLDDYLVSRGGDSK